jgi:ribosomal protein S18 acetylase RimI-like enzyme
MSDTDFQICFEEYPSPLFDEIDELRYRVLFEPFGVGRDDDWNDADPSAAHALALAGGRVVGYARLITEQDGRTGQIRQVAVDPAWERRGLGSALMRTVLGRAAEEGLTDVWLNARMSAVPFYEKLGFRVTSGMFHAPRTYLPHVRMDRAL